MIHLDETPDADRIDSATLPPFSNNSCCSTPADGLLDPAGVAG